MPMQQETLPFIPKVAHAVLSDDRKYRYVLYRSLDGRAWDAEQRPDGMKRLTVCFVMLNPSTADESTNDPTIEKLIRYGATWGFQRLAVVNVYAIIETDSKELRRQLRACAEPDSNSWDGHLVGPLNKLYVNDVIRASTKIVCGWGNEGVLRAGSINAELREIGHEYWCFKKNLNGTPVHPLYQRDNASLIPYEPSP
jgi:hypothetical protein